VLEYLRGKEQKIVDDYVASHKLSPMTLKDMVTSSVLSGDSGVSEASNI
jgi:hypothetical protein